MKKVVIIGYGSAGRRHANILIKYFDSSSIYVLTKQKIKKFKTFYKLNYIKNINPDYIVIASETFKHFNQLKFLEKNFKNKKILVEKPLFHNDSDLKIKNNIVYINYNLRFHPLFSKLKDIIKKNKIYDIKFITNSFLPNWRKHKLNKKSYALYKSRGGGVILDLSHELDLIKNIFSKLEIKYIDFGKKSNITSNSEDFLKLYGRHEQVNISLDLSYYSRNEIRLILIDCKNSSFFIDLKNNIFKSNKVKKTFDFKKIYNQNYTFSMVHKAIINGKDKNKLCSYNQAIKVMKFISLLKRSKKKFQFNNLKLL